MNITIPNRYTIVPVEPVNTIQIFITNKCNKKCPECFYQDYMEDRQHMSGDQYSEIINLYKKDINKVILLGGEPTMHPQLRDFVRYNYYNNLKTTVYTNGWDTSKLQDCEFNSTIRLGVTGFDHGEKTIKELDLKSIKLDIVFMLAVDNIDQLLPTAQFADSMGCKNFYISSIRDIRITKDYWKDTPNTIELNNYAKIVETFLSVFQPKNLKQIHIARRGVIDNASSTIDHCRFLNIYPNGKTTICPFDISLKVEDPPILAFKGRKCRKHTECLLQKLILEVK